MINVPATESKPAPMSAPAETKTHAEQTSDHANTGKRQDDAPKPRKERDKESAAEQHGGGGRRWLVILLVTGAAAGAAIWFLTHRPSRVEWQGYAEADFIKVGPTQQGLLTEVKVNRGDLVNAGDLLFTQDDVADKAALATARHQLDQALERLANLQAPGRPSEVQRAEAELADSVATRERLKGDLDRAQTLVKSGAETVQNRDQINGNYLSAAARVRALEAALARMRDTTGRESEIKAQQAAVEAARSDLARAKWRLDQDRVVAPKTGVIADVMARPGETVMAGAPVVSLLPLENIFVRFFVPEAMLIHLHRGDEVQLLCDTGPQDLRGTIDFVAPQAEYTPPVIYSVESRAKLVYMMQARPRPDQAKLFKPGQPVTVRPIEKIEAKEKDGDERKR